MLIFINNPTYEIIKDCYFWGECEILRIWFTLKYVASQKFYSILIKSWASNEHCTSKTQLSIICLNSQLKGKTIEAKGQWETKEKYFPKILHYPIHVFMLRKNYPLPSNAKERMEHQMSVFSSCLSISYVEESCTVVY